MSIFTAMQDIYSPENIARSRARAASFRRLAEEVSEPDRSEYLDAAGAIEAYADEREQEAASRAAGQEG